MRVTNLVRGGNDIDDEREGQHSIPAAQSREVADPQLIGARGDFAFDEIRRPDRVTVPSCARRSLTASARSPARGDPPHPAADHGIDTAAVTSTALHTSRLLDSQLKAQRVHAAVDGLVAPPESSPGTWCTGMKLRSSVRSFLSARRVSVVAVPGRGLWENAGRAGRCCAMGCEPAGVTGRPCDLPGCAASANP